VGALKQLLRVFVQDRRTTKVGRAELLDPGKLGMKCLHIVFIIVRRDGILADFLTLVKEGEKLCLAKKERRK
jgi:hypothetical protein